MKTIDFSNLGYFDYISLDDDQYNYVKTHIVDKIWDYWVDDRYRSSYEIWKHQFLVNHRVSEHTFKSLSMLARECERQFTARQQRKHKAQKVRGRW